MVNHQSGRSTPPFGKEAACGKFVDATKETEADLVAELEKIVSVICVKLLQFWESEKWTDDISSVHSWDEISSPKNGMKGKDEIFPPSYWT